jgi:hypothetical protein
MMGLKERTFAPLANVSLEDLVPAGHFYRHVERSHTPNPSTVILPISLVEFVVG